MYTCVLRLLFRGGEKLRIKKEQARHYIHARLRPVDSEKLFFVFVCGIERRSERRGFVVVDPVLRKGGSTRNYRVGARPYDPQTEMCT